jgi:tRNA(fMet)-specific endonuclease VapC
VAVLVDTSVLVEFERRGDEPPGDDFLGGEERAISVVTVSELLHGVRRASEGRRARRQAFVEGLLATIRPIEVTEAVARVHAEIWSGLAVKGETIGAHDLWIAATAVTHGMGVATKNTDEFGRVPGLRVVRFEP